MATDSDEQLRQQRELEEIRRSFAEMGARMGSLFEPADPDDPAGPRQSAQPPVPTGPLPLGLQGRPRWWWAAALALLFVAGTAFGWILPKGSGGDSEAAPPPQTTTATTAAPKPTVATRTVPSVPEQCLEAAELADEIISALTRNERDERLGVHLRDYSVANQACREEASP
jgi:hypothetical protein